MFDETEIDEFLSGNSPEAIGLWMCAELDVWHRAPGATDRLERFAPFVLNPRDRPLHQIYRFLEASTLPERRTLSLLDKHKRKLVDASRRAFESWGALMPLKGFADLIWYGNALAVPGLIDHIVHTVRRPTASADAVSLENCIGEILHALKTHPAAASFEGMIYPVRAMKASELWWRKEHATDFARELIARRPSAWLHVFREFSIDLLACPEIERRRLLQQAVPVVGLEEVFQALETLDPRPGAPLARSEFAVFSSLFEPPLGLRVAEDSIIRLTPWTEVAIGPEETSVAVVQTRQVPATFRASFKTMAGEILFLDRISPTNSWLCGKFKDACDREKLEQRRRGSERQIELLSASFCSILEAGQDPSTSEVRTRRFDALQSQLQAGIADWKLNRDSRSPSKLSEGQTLP